jgi:5-methylcytosine-specific restriction endonuclease McrA
MSRKKTCSCGRIIPEGTRCECKRKKKRDYMREYQRNEVDNPLKTTRWSKHVRPYVLRRDNYLCQRCLHKFGEANPKELQVHHIKSRKNYPDLVFDTSNLLTVCKTCNLQLGTKDELDFELR